VKRLAALSLLALAACSTPGPDTATARLTIAGKPYECVTSSSTDLGSEMRCRTVDL